MGGLLIRRAARGPRGAERPLARSSRLPTATCSLRPPLPQLGKAIRQHHMLHHTRHEGYWLAFIVPQVRGSASLPSAAQHGAGGGSGESLLGRSCRAVRCAAPLEPASRLLSPRCRQVDQLFGTAPPPGSVRMSDMARATLKSARGG